jgi:hypothetical protein
MDGYVSPYELLGLVSNKCTIQDVRKAYYELALICHPDKGGNANDMRVLQAAYDWIMTQMTSIKERGGETYEEKEDNFKAFLESQVQYKVVPFTEVVQNVAGYTEELFERVYERAKDNDDPLTKQFVKQYVTNCIMYHVGRGADASIEDVVEREVKAYFAMVAKTQWSYASIQDGYGAYLDVGSGVSQPFGKTEMIVYEEPMVLPAKLGETIEQPKQLEDYTQGDMCDYRVAFKDTERPLAVLEQQHPPNTIANPLQDILEARQLDRRLDDMNLEKEDSRRSVLLRFQSQARKLAS